MNMDLYVGQRVRCIRETDDDREWQARYGKRSGVVFPCVGNVYVVRWLGDYAFSHGVDAALRLVEITNPVLSWSDNEVNEVAFRISRFRPLDERKTDIAIFTEILHKVGSKEPSTV